MSVDILRDSANTRSQQRGSFKGEGYTMKASTRSQHRRNLKGEGHKNLFQPPQTRQ